jgi:hypothetical protein
MRTLLGPIPVVLALCAAGPARAGPPEEEILALYHGDKLLTARRKAEELLAENPDSIEANFVLGCVLRQAEGDLARAMHHLGRSRELFEARYGTLGENSDLHQQILDKIVVVAGELEEYEYQLQMLDYYDALFDPDLSAEHAWPLMKLERYDEARAYAQRGIDSGTEWGQLVGYNALCALEAEAGNREAALTACENELEFGRTRADVDLTVAGYNASIAAQYVLAFDKVERYATEAVTSGAAGNVTNPWLLLVSLYVAQGRGQEAVVAVGDMQRWRALQAPEYRDQIRAETDAAFATVLLAAGETDKGMEVITRALEFPDRRGLTSASSEQALGSHALLRIAMRKAAAERTAEEASAYNLFVRLGHWLSTWWPDTEDWKDRAAVSGALTDERRLHSTFRVYADGGLSDVPVWLLGELADVLGPGVAETALRDARATEADPRFTAYYDAIDVDIAYARGDRSAARASASGALAGLPASEKLLRARVAAIGAECARRQGDDGEALALFEQAMADDPGVLRRLGLRLPASVTVNATGDAAPIAGRMIARSPRLRLREGAFQVTVEGDGRALRTCLRSPSGRQLSCATTVPPSPETSAPARGTPGAAPPPAAAPEEPEPLTARGYAMLVARDFHDHAFSMALGVSTADLRSLDGGSTIATEATRARMGAMLEGILRESSGAR